MRYAYLRVSTREQAENGNGLDAQRAAILSLGPVDAWHADEGESGSNGLDSRLGLATALQELHAGDELVVYKLDRLARDLVLQETLLRTIREKGARLISCSESETALLEDDEADPSRKLIRQILGAVAEYERAMIRMRMMAGKAIRKAQGAHVCGPAPFGWKIGPDKYLVMDGEQQRTLAAMRDLRALGLSYRAVADQLNVLEYPSERGGPWSAASVHKILGRNIPNP